MNVNLFLLGWNPCELQDEQLVSFFLTKNYVYKCPSVCRPYSYFTSPLCLCSEQWFHSILPECLRYWYYGNIFSFKNQWLRLWRLKSPEDVYEEIFDRTLGIGPYSCVESLFMYWNFINTVSLRKTRTSLVFIPWSNRNNCHDKNVMAPKNNLKQLWKIVFISQ